LYKYASELKDAKIDHILNMMRYHDPINKIKLYMAGVDINKVQLYKVLGNKNQSIHGGKYCWTLNEPTKLINPYRIKMCSEGYHLTANPMDWANQCCW